MIKIYRFISILSLFLFFNCNKFTDKNFTKEFAKFVSDSDQVLFEGDILHPVYAYLKNGKLKGLEVNNHPECGDYTKRYFFSEDEKLMKIVIEKNYDNESCGKTFDSIFVIDPVLRKTIIYTKDTYGKEISSNMIQNEEINIDQYKEKIKYWKNKS